MVKYSKLDKTFDDWVELITNKFQSISLLETSVIINALNITDLTEINIVKKAHLISFAKKYNVLSFENACKKLKLSPTKILSLLNKNQTANYKLGTIIEVLNNGWKPNWMDSNEKKFYPYFYMKDGVFCYNGWTCNISIMDVPSALYLKSSEYAYFMGMYYIDLYKDLYL